MSQLKRIFLLNIFVPLVTDTFNCRQRQTFFDPKLKIIPNFVIRTYIADQDLSRGESKGFQKPISWYEGHNLARPVSRSTLFERLRSKRVFTWENSHRREFHTGMTFWFCIPFTWWHTSCQQNIRVIQNRTHYACATRSSPLADRFPTETCGCFAFT